MKILYCHDNFYEQGPDGTVYSPGQFPYSYWKPFLDVFDHLVVAGRSRPLQSHPISEYYNISSGRDVTFNLFPNINTPAGRLKYIKSVDKSLKNLVEEVDGVIIRAVSDLGWIVYKHAWQMKKPIAMEMAACAWDSTWNHGNRFGKLYAPIRYFRDKKIAKSADYVIYVSEAFLQNRYPTAGQVTVASNVRINKTPQVTLKRRLERIKMVEEKQLPYRIGLIGNLDNSIKGVADALDALACVQEQKKSGCFEFFHLGPGYPEPYEQQAKMLNIDYLVNFEGTMQSGDAVLEWLDKIDLYIQPSYQEGVPRATIEAMSRGCPVVASTAGGIPELISEQWLHKPGKINELSDLILKMIQSPNLQVKAARENFAKAQTFTNEILMPRRTEFWQSYAEFAKDRNKAYAA